MTALWHWVRHGARLIDGRCLRCLTDAHAILRRDGARTIIYADHAVTLAAEQASRSESNLVPNAERYRL